MLTLFALIGCHTAAPPPAPTTYTTTDVDTALHNTTVSVTGVLTERVTMMWGATHHTIDLGDNHLVVHLPAGLTASDLEGGLVVATGNLTLSVNGENYLSKSPVSDGASVTDPMMYLPLAINAESVIPGSATDEIDDTLHLTSAMRAHPLALSGTLRHMERADGSGEDLIVALPSERIVRVMALKKHMAELTSLIGQPVTLGGNLVPAIPDTGYVAQPGVDGIIGQFHADLAFEVSELPQ